MSPQLPPGSPPPCYPLTGPTILQDGGHVHSAILLPLAGFSRGKYYFTSGSRPSNLTSFRVIGSETHFNGQPAQFMGYQEPNGMQRCTLQGNETYQEIDVILHFKITRIYQKHVQYELHNSYDNSVTKRYSNISFYKSRLLRRARTYYPIQKGER